MTSSLPPKRPAIWWSNIIFFCGTHLAAAHGVYHRPPSTVPKAILIATIALWQLASLGCAYHYQCFMSQATRDSVSDRTPRCSVTIGYHRLYSHRTFSASLGVRIVLAVIGASAFQGSIKVRYINILCAWNVVNEFHISGGT
jgi:stearoyl-CoA desaturase (Delta-9 desaturase)